MPIPPHGTAPDELLEQLRAARADDVDYERGRAWSLVYPVDPEHTALLREAYGAFLSANGLNPMAFPSLRRLEREVVEMTASMLNGPEACGSVTSGGTESILLAVKTARDAFRAEHPGTAPPQLVLPRTAHPAFVKAARYFDLEPVFVEVEADFRVSADAMADAITDRTALLVASAPNYPFGVVDPIAEIGAIAEDRAVLLHVDGCFGGFLLPWVEKLGRAVPPFDFRVPGVTSLSADVHKYGYAAKGASVVLYRERTLRRHQFCAYSGWPGGLYGSPTLAGTRPGGAIAAAWASLHHLGQEGLLRLTDQVLASTDRLIAGLRGIDGLAILGDPIASALSFTSERADVYALADALTARGWHMDRQQRPAALHLTVTPAHDAAVVEAFLADLRALHEEVAAQGPATEGMAALYGMVGTLPAGPQLDELIRQFLDGLDVDAGSPP